MKARKYFILILLLISSVELYPFEFSLGTTIGGVGIGFIRENSNIYVPEASIIFDNAVSIYTMFEFHKYFALEAYLGIGNKVYYFGNNEKEHHFSGFSASMLARGQYEFNRIVLYGSLGMKLKFDMYSLDFVPDVLFDLGFETRIGNANYLGLRAEYILDTTPTSSQRYPSLAYDALTFSLTYRYAFNSKHNKSN